MMVVTENSEENSEENIENFEEQEGGVVPNLPVNYKRVNKPGMFNFNIMRQKTSSPSTESPTPPYNPTKPIVKILGEKDLKTFRELATPPDTYEVTYMDNFNKDYRKYINFLLYESYTQNLPDEERNMQKNMQKLNVAQPLCRLMLLKTKQHITYLFDKLSEHIKFVFDKLSADLAMDDTGITEKGEELLKNLDFKLSINIVEIIENTINEQFNDVKTNPNIEKFFKNENIIEFFLQLLTIYYYPIMICEDIATKMINYVKYIAKNSNQILTEDRFKANIKDMVTNLLTSNPHRGGGFFDAWLGSPNFPTTATASQMRAERSMRYADDTLEKQNQEFLKRLKDFNTSSSPYVRNSGLMFYKALTNFAVSLTINNTDDYKNDSHQGIISADKLTTIFKDVLNVDNNSTAKTQLETLTQEEIDANKEVTRLSSAFYRTYEGEEVQSLEDYLEYNRPVANANNATDTALNKSIRTTKNELNILTEKLIKTNKLFRDLRTAQNKHAVLQKNLQKTSKFLQNDKNEFYNKILTMNTKDYHIELMSDIFQDKSNCNYYLPIENSIVEGIRNSKMFVFDKQNYTTHTSVSAAQQQITAQNTAQQSPPQQQLLSPPPQQQLLSPPPPPPKLPKSGFFGIFGNKSGGKRRTRRYKKRAGTRRQKKRRGTHRKRKNTTR